MPDELTDRVRSAGAVLDAADRLERLAVDVVRDPLLSPEVLSAELTLLARSLAASAPVVLTSGAE